MKPEKEKAEPVLASASPLKIHSQKCFPFIGKARDTNFLLQVGNRNNEAGEIALKSAIILGQMNSVRALLAATYETKLNSIHETLLMRLSSLGDAYTDIATALLRADSDPDIRNNEGNTALLIAIDASLPFDSVSPEPPPLVQYTKMVNALLQFNANPDETGENEETALIKAVFLNNIKMARDLLVHSANVNKRVTDGTTALFTAVVSGHRECEELLLKWRADLRIPMCTGMYTYIRMCNRTIGAKRIMNKLFSVWVWVLGGCLCTFVGVWVGVCIRLRVCGSTYMYIFKYLSYSSHTKHLTHTLLYIHLHTFTHIHYHTSTHIYVHTHT